MENLRYLRRPETGCLVARSKRRSDKCPWTTIRVEVLVFEPCRSCSRVVKHRLECLSQFRVDAGRPVHLDDVPTWNRSVKKGGRKDVRGLEVPGTADPVIGSERTAARWIDVVGKMVGRALAQIKNAPTSVLQRHNQETSNSTTTGQWSDRAQAASSSAGA